MNYVYVIRCADDSLYTGWTNDLENRIKQHNAGKGAKFPQWSRIYVSFILPAIVLFIFIMGYIQKFVK